MPRIGPGARLAGRDFARLDATEDRWLIAS